MKMIPTNMRLLIPSLILLFTTSATAQVFRLGGGLRPGFARPPLHLNINPHDATSNYGPYSPQQIRHAYGVDLLHVTGTSQTIGIIDAYGDPSIQTDLNNFCNYYGIASTTVQILYPQGMPRPSSSGWALETALDVEWAHAIAPDATIILSVAKSASTTDLLGAVVAAVNAGATVISMSWGTTEFTGANAYDVYFQAPGVTYVASSGDSGEMSAPFEVEWPASSPYVVSVGGTTLYLDANGNRIIPTGVPSSETGWSSSGGGISYVYAAPSFQSSWLLSWGIGNRTVPDVSYVADPSTGVGVVYGPYLYEVGGTSIGAPQWAALIALANQARSGSGFGDSAIYAAAGPAPKINPSNFTDITSGSNDKTPDTDDFSVIGYDLVTGLGSPLANGLVPALTPQPDFSLSVTPGAQTVVIGNSAGYNVTVSQIGAFSGPVSFNVSGLPAGANATFTPISFTGGSATSTLTIGTRSATPKGTYTITIIGTGGGLVHQVTATLVVVIPDFSISASPSSRSIRRGTSTTYAVNVTSLNTFSGRVSLSVSGLPTGANATFTSNPVTGGSSSTMNVLTLSTATTGSFRLTITGTSGSLVHSANVSLSITR